MRSWLVSVKVLSVKWSSGEHSGMSGSKSWGFTALQLLSREQLMHCLAAFTARGRYSMLSVWPGKKPSLKRPFLNSKVEISSSHHPGSASQLPQDTSPVWNAPLPAESTTALPLIPLKWFQTEEWMCELRTFSLKPLIISTKTGDTAAQLPSAQPARLVSTSPLMEVTQAKEGPRRNSCPSAGIKPQREWTNPSSEHASDISLARGHLYLSVPPEAPRDPKDWIQEGALTLHD